MFFIKNDVIWTNDSCTWMHKETWYITVWKEMFCIAYFNNIYIALHFTKQLCVIQAFKNMFLMKKIVKTISFYVCRITQTISNTMWIMDEREGRVFSVETSVNFLMLIQLIENMQGYSKNWHTFIVLHV